MIDIDKSTNYLISPIMQYLLIKQDDDQFNYEEPATNVKIWFMSPV